MEQLQIINIMEIVEDRHTPYTTESWKKIPDWPYEVSSLGNIRRQKSRQFIWKSVGNLRGGTLPNGYRIITLSRPDGSGLGFKKCFSWHKLVANAFLGPCPEGMEIDHKDSNPGNNRADNLRYVTCQHNIQHSVLNGHRGTSRWNSKLTSAKVRLIREMHANGIKVKAIAQETGVSEGAIYHVIKGENWKHVK